MNTGAFEYVAVVVPKGKRDWNADVVPQALFPDLSVTASAVTIRTVE